MLVKAIRSNIPTLTPIWEGPYSVMLSSPTTVKVTGIGAQIHHTWIRTWNPSGENQEGHPASPEESSQYSEYQCTPLEGLKGLFKKSPGSIKSSPCDDWPHSSFWDHLTEFDVNLHLVETSDPLVLLLLLFGPCILNHLSCSAMSPIEASDGNGYGNGAKDDISRSTRTSHVWRPNCHPLSMPLSSSKKPEWSSPISPLAVSISISRGGGGRIGVEIVSECRNSETSWFHKHPTLLN